ncbi:MAG TPA: HPr family phosphocarrier protein [Candidatus Galloscillospira excrementavium]|nr:HPr family phosphocarrier protein [Candidatus Galloscillospira excrementavium]
MNTLSVTLGSVPEVRTFADIASHYSCEIDVLSGRYVVDAKSILGLFSLELAHPVTVEFHGSEEQFAAFAKEVQPFVTKA